MEIKLGDQFKFAPSGWTWDNRDGYKSPVWLQRTVVGTVVQINREHHWFRVRYETALGVGHECFKLPVLHERLTRIKN